MRSQICIFFVNITIIFIHYLINFNDKSISIITLRFFLKKCITDGFSKFSKEELWKHCLKDHLGQYYQLYQEHESLPSKMDAEIIKDVTRTYPLDSLFQTASNQMKMFHITRMYCLIDPCVGYCQGMCFPVGAFLKFFDEKLAFGCVMHIFKELKMRHFFQVEKFTLTEVSARMTEAIEVF